MAIDFLATAPMKITSLKEKTTESDVEEREKRVRNTTLALAAGGPHRRQN